MTTPQPFRVVAGAEDPGGDAWGWLRAVIAQQGPMLWRFVLPRVAGMEDVADGVCQETWEALARQAEPPRDIGAWLRGTARHKVLDQFRRERRLAFWEIPLEAIGRAGMADPEFILDARWQAAEVYAALRRLSPRARQALILYYIEGWTVAELAELFGRSAKAVECQLYRARVAFRRVYTEAAADD